MITAQDVDEQLPAIPYYLRNIVYLDCLPDKTYVLTNTVTRQKVTFPEGKYELVWNATGTSFQFIGIGKDGKEYDHDEEEMNHV